MGPITLFDKSFLQSLSVDESVWFDHFFLCNICPLFYAETLADLTKEGRRSPGDEVRIIADKFPERGSPSLFHLAICEAELLGRHEVPLTGQIVLPGGKSVPVDGKEAVYFEESPEAIAFARWSRGQYAEIEREQARAWRSSLQPLDSERLQTFLESIGVEISECKSLSLARDVAREVVAGRERYTDPMQFIFLFLPKLHQDRLIAIWNNEGCPPLVKFAPYTAFVISIQLFLFIATANSLITTRPSNCIDMAYLFYLPFCQVFVSSDKLHRRTVPLFLRNDQTFEWGPELKSSLQDLNTHYLTLPETVREQGIFSFAPEPPKELDNSVCRLWDQHHKGWRSAREQDRDNREGRDKEVLEFVEIMRKIKSGAKTAGASSHANSQDGPAIVSVAHRVRRVKGSWHQVPKGLKVEE